MIPVAARPGAYRDLIARQFETRNTASRVFFAREAERLAAACAEMSARFLRGGRLLALGSGSAATDAQHVAVEFVHPVVAGKRALPAMDLSGTYLVTLPAIVRPQDVVMGFDSPVGDPAVAAALREASRRGAFTLALPGAIGDYATAMTSPDPFIHQEIVEILYHTLWETVHVFFERESVGHGAGAAGFLYPFLGEDPPQNAGLVAEVAASIRAKAACDEGLRDLVVSKQGSAIVAAAQALQHRVARGGSIFCFGNGGSATDATDLAFDLAASPKGHEAVAAMSLVTDPATLTAIANDIGAEAMFLRQLIAHGKPGDVAVAISTSGGSASIISGLIEARSRGLLTLALVGYHGGEILRRQLADHVIVVESDQIPRIQEVHASIYHVMLDVLDEMRRGR